MDEVLKEYKRLKKLLVKTGVSPEKISALDPILQNTAWMKVNLEEGKKYIEIGALIDEYNNGGGQRGIRENPLFKAYENLWKSYMQGMNVIISTMPETSVEVKKEEIEKPKNMLEFVRERKRA